MNCFVFAVAMDIGLCVLTLCHWKSTGALGCLVMAAQGEGLGADSGAFVLWPVHPLRLMTSACESWHSDCPVLLLSLFLHSLRLAGPRAPCSHWSLYRSAQGPLRVSVPVLSFVWSHCGPYCHLPSSQMCFLITVTRCLTKQLTGRIYFASFKKVIYYFFTCIGILIAYMSMWGCQL